jgi:hypothetical protein
LGATTPIPLITTLFTIIRHPGRPAHQEPPDNAYTHACTFFKN